MNVSGAGAMAGGIAQGYQTERNFQQRQAANEQIGAMIKQRRAAMGYTDPPEQPGFGARLVARLIGQHDPATAKLLDPTYDPAAEAGVSSQPAGGASVGKATTSSTTGAGFSSGTSTPSGMGTPVSGPGPLAADRDRGMAANDSGGKPNGPVVGGPADAAPAGAAPVDNPSNSNPGAPIPQRSTGGVGSGSGGTAPSPGMWDDDQPATFVPGPSQVSSRKAKRGPVTEQPHKPPTGTRGTGLDQADIDSPQPVSTQTPTRRNPMAKGLTPVVPTYQNYDPPNLGAPNASL